MSMIQREILPFIIQHAKWLCPCGRISRIFILRGMRDRSMRIGTKLAPEIQLPVNPLLSPPSQISPALSNKLPLFTGGKLLSPPPSPSPILYSSQKNYHQRLTWIDQLWFIQAGSSYCLYKTFTCKCKIKYKEVSSDFPL